MKFSTLKSERSTPTDKDIKFGRIVVSNLVKGTLEHIKREGKEDEFSLYAVLKMLLNASPDQLAEMGL